MGLNYFGVAPSLSLLFNEWITQISCFLNCDKINVILYSYLSHRQCFHVYILYTLFIRRYLLRWVEQSLLSASACKAEGHDVILLPKTFIIDTIAMLRTAMVCYVIVILNFDKNMLKFQVVIWVSNDRFVPLLDQEWKSYQNWSEQAHWIIDISLVCDRLSVSG